MLINDFWNIIEESRRLSGGQREKQLEMLRQELSEYTSDTIKSYCIYMMGLLKKACTEEIWAAYYLMNGGYQEWGFEDFRYWLIAQGREFWEKTLQNPVDFLYENVNIQEGENPEVTFYEFWHLFKTVYEQKSGVQLSNSIEWLKIYEEVQKAELALEKITRPLAHSYQIRKKYPQLYEKFFQQYYYLLKKHQEEKAKEEK